MTTKRPRGRQKGTVAEFDPDFVADICEQIDVAYYNQNQDKLREKLLRDPNAIAMFRARANKGHAAIVRAILRALGELDRLGYVKSTEEEYQKEVCYLLYIDQLEESASYIRRELEMGSEPIWRERSRLYAVTVARALAARERVISQQPLKLKRPALVNLSDDNEEDAFA